MPDLLRTLLLMAFALLSFTISYILLIYHRNPFKTGWGWISVAVSEIVNDLIVSAAIIAVLDHFAILGHLWWIAIFPFIAHALSEGPRIVAEIRKYRSQRRRNKELDREIDLSPIGDI